MSYDGYACNAVNGARASNDVYMVTMKTTYWKYRLHKHRHITQCQYRTCPIVWPFYHLAWFDFNFSYIFCSKAAVWAKRKTHMSAVLMLFCRFTL